MTELIHGATSILNGLIYHADNYQSLQNELDSIEFMNPEQNTVQRATIDKMNHEVIAYFNRIGQFYYFASSQNVAKILDEFKNHIPHIMRLKIFRMKQSAHRATDAPKGENPNNMAQLDRLFTYQSIMINNKLMYQVLLDKEDSVTGRQSVNFFLHEDHPKVVEEIKKIIELINIE